MRTKYVRIIDKMVYFLQKEIAHNVKGSSNIAKLELYTVL